MRRASLATPSRRRCENGRARVLRLKMSAGEARAALPRRAASRPWQRYVPIFVLAPSLTASFVYVVVFSLWTVWISLSRSTLLPDYGYAGFQQYALLWSNHRWSIAYTNLFIFGALYVLGATVLGLLLAILIDQR